jgi:hypothetical protein
MSQQSESAQVILHRAVDQLSEAMVAWQRVHPSASRSMLQLACDLVSDSDCDAERRQTGVRTWMGVTEFIRWIEAARDLRIRELCHYSDAQTRKVANRGAGAYRR